MTNVTYVVLFTSGIDSHIGRLYLKNYYHGITPVFVYYDLRSRYSDFEISFIRENFPDVIIERAACDLAVSEKWDAYIPVRNLILACLAVNRFESSTEKLIIYFSTLKEDTAPDANKETFDLLSKTLTQASNIKVEVKSTFSFKMTKLEAVDWYLEHYENRKEELVTKTFSCYNPVQGKEDPHCYSCAACFRRNVALQKIKILPFKNKDLVTKYLLRALNGEFSEERSEQIKSYCKEILEG